MHRTQQRAWLWAATLAVAATTVGTQPAQADGSQAPGKRSRALKVALVGDVPYGDHNIVKYDRVIDDINAAKVSLVVHVGDIKGGSSECSDERLVTRFEQNERFRAPFVLTPGDNEWTDCHRTAAGMYNPNERLAKLREVFYPRPGRTTGGRRMRVEAQAADPAYAKFVENVRFIKSDVLFVTVHVVGSNNGLALWNGIGETADAPFQERLDEVAEREAAALAWLRSSFELAHERGVAGVLVAIHANPRFETPASDPGRAGFNAFLAALEEEVSAFEHPVALVHGDSHYYRQDKPLLADTVADGRQRLPNFTRIEVFGSNDVHWVEMVVDTRTASVFDFHEVIVPDNRFER